MFSAHGGYRLLSFRILIGCVAIVLSFFIFTRKAVLQNMSRENTMAQNGGSLYQEIDKESESFESRQNKEEDPQDNTSVYGRMGLRTVSALTVLLAAFIVLVTLAGKERHAALLGDENTYYAVSGETCPELISSEKFFQFLLPCASYAPNPDAGSELRCFSAEEAETTMQNLPEWQLNGNSIQRSFEFDDFQKAFYFMAQVAQTAERNQHHPTWTNTWNTVDVTLTTDDKDCLSTYDIALAEAMDSLFDRE